MKIGDKIKCVKFDTGLILDKDYEVASYSPTWCGRRTPVITIKGSSSSYYANHFILLENEQTKIMQLKIGDTVKCIDSNESNSLRFGKTYNVVAINEYGNIQVKIDGETLQHFYKPIRFKMLPRSPKICLTKEYKTKNGLSVRLIGLSNAKSYPVIGEIIEDGEVLNAQWTELGEYYGDDNESAYDLVEKKTQQTIDCGNFDFHVYNDGSAYIRDGHSLRMTLNSDEMKKIVEAFNSFQ